MSSHSRALTLLAALVTVALVPWAAPGTAAAQRGIPNQQYTEGSAIDDQELNAMFAVLDRMSWLKADKKQNVDANGRLVPDWAEDPGTQILIVHDVDADGKRVGVHWRIPGTTKRGLCVNKRGKDYNSSMQAGAGTYCRFLVPEGKRVLYRLGSCDNDRHSCGGVKDWTQKLGNWNWQKLTKAPWIQNGWMDYYDDKDNDERNGCDETADDHPDC